MIGADMVMRLTVNLFTIETPKPLSRQAFDNKTAMIGHAA